MSHISNMSNSSLPQEYAYRAEVEKAIRKTTEAIEAAFGHIERQEDGPITMRYALKEIDNGLSEVENQISYLIGTLLSANDFTAQMIEQRDNAIRERDRLMAMIDTKARRAHRRKGSPGDKSPG